MISTRPVRGNFHESFGARTSPTHRAGPSARAEHMREPTAPTPLPACFGGARKHTLKAPSRWTKANLSAISWPHRCGACPVISNLSSLHHFAGAAAAVVKHSCQGLPLDCDRSCYCQRAAAATAVPKLSGSSSCGRSQEGQDYLAAALLAGAAEEANREGRVPTFLEMGGGDGVTLSNTFLMEACFGWHGILVEALPSLSRSICESRPRALAFSFAVCHPHQDAVNFSVPLEFKVGPPPAGSVGFRPCTGTRPVAKCTAWIRGQRGYYVEKWAIAAAEQTRNPETQSRIYSMTVRIPCAPLNAMLTTARVTHLDFVSLDVEGAEAVAIRTLDWQRLSAHLIQVEQSSSALEKNQEVRDILWARGFVHVATVWVWKAHLADEFFVNGTYLRRHLAQVAAVVPRLSTRARAKLLAVATSKRRAGVATNTWSVARRILERSAREPRLFRQPDVYYRGPF